MPYYRVHHYALETSITLGKCLQRLRETLEAVTSSSSLSSNDDDNSNHYYAPSVLYDLEASLMEISRLLHAHLVLLVERERELLLELEYALLEDGDGLEDSSLDRIPSSLHESVEVLQLVVKQKKQRQAELEERKLRERSPILMSQPAPKKKNGTSSGTSTTSGEHSMEQPDNKRRSRGGTDLYGRRKPPTRSRSAEDTMLFRLTVALQLCILRIDDAHYALTGQRHRKSDISDDDHDIPFEDVWMDRLWKSIIMFTTCTGGSMLWKRHRQLKLLASSDASVVSPASQKSMLSLAGGVAATVGGIWVARWVVKRIWMNNKIVNSIASLEEWTQQWTHTTTTELVGQSGKEDSNNRNNKSQRLIDYALKSSPKSAFWHSEGEIRFQLLKRAMDLYYASVGRAITTHEDSDVLSSTSNVMQVSLTAMAAASYYNLVGPHRAATKATADPSSRNRLIHTAWSMISLPSIKLFSLRATRLLKGAALAERITIAGVSCFVLSKARCPEVAACIKRYQRQERRRGQPVSLSGSCRKLSIIDENSEISAAAAASPPSSRKSSMATNMHRGSCEGFSTGVYRRRNVIFHLTGGGFFAHTLASDLPYLLDWSAKTDAIVICPEYSLLPEHPFPKALEDVVDVYASLLSSSSFEVAAMLGFEVDQIIVTGESAGGNLAASLLLKLIDEQQKAAVKNKLKERQARGSETTSSTGSRASSQSSSMYSSLSLNETVRLPNALMLSCPALNLSLELSPSRVIGHDDPVLPTGLISAISDAYIPESVSKEDPLASPFFADDRWLRQFPPTLLFASSDDPLLDDSVEFNRRLRCLGVPSELRAVQHVPHAYWGLATAGFPEAQQVQGECVDFLYKHLFQKKKESSSCLMTKYIT